MRTRLLARAMRHPDKPGAGAAKRRKLGLTGREKAAVVMREYHHGTLRSRSGEVVKDEQQAKAIAMSEGRRAEEAEMMKKGGAHHRKAHKKTHKAATHHKAHHSAAHHSPKHHAARPSLFGPHHASHPVHHATGEPSPSVHTSHAGHHPKHSYASGAPASEWDRLWHAYVEANEKGSLSEQIRAGKRLLRFDRIHGTPPMQHVVHMLREAKDLLAKHKEAFKEARKLESELERADGHVKRHKARHAHATAHHHGLSLGLRKGHKGHKSHGMHKAAKAHKSLF